MSLKCKRFHTSLYIHLILKYKMNAISYSVIMIYVLFCTYLEQRPVYGEYRLIVLLFLRNENTRLEFS